MATNMLYNLTAAQITILNDLLSKAHDKAQTEKECDTYEKIGVALEHPDVDQIPY